MFNQYNARDILDKNYINESKFKEEPMNHVQNYARYLDDLIIENAEKSQDGWYLDFQDLNQSEQGNLIALKIINTDYETDELYLESDKTRAENTFTQALMSLLRNHSPLEEKRFISIIRKRIASYYLNDIQDDLNMRCMKLRSSWFYNKGFNE